MVHGPPTAVDAVSDNSETAGASGPRGSVAYEALKFICSREKDTTELVGSGELVAELRARVSIVG